MDTNTAPDYIQTDVTKEQAAEAVLVDIEKAYIDAIAALQEGTVDRTEALRRVQAATALSYDRFPQFNEDEVANASTFDGTRKVSELREQFDKLSMPEYDEIWLAILDSVAAYREDLEHYTQELVQASRESSISSIQMLYGMYLLDQYRSLSRDIIAVRAVEKQEGLEDELRANLRKVREILKSITQ